MAQDVKLKFTGDTSELEKALSASVKKIQNEADKLKIGPSAARAPGVDSVRDAAQAKRNLTDRIRDEKAGLDLINRELEKKKRLIDDLSKQQAAVKGNLEKESSFQKEINKELEKTRRIKEQIQIQETNYKRAQAAYDRVRGIEKNPQPMPNQGADFKDLIKKVGGVAGITSLVTTALKVGPELYRSYGEAPIQNVSLQGSAIQGTFGRELQNIYSGRSALEGSFIGEKARAAQMAQANLANRKTYDLLSINSKIGADTAIGIGAGTLGGPIGMLIGGGIGTAVGTGSALMDPRMRARILSEISPTYKQQYEAMNAQEFGENYQKAYEGLKNENPLKTLAAENYNSNYRQNLEFQRSTGLDYNTFHGKNGFRENAINAGFEDTLATGMSSAIMGAGGGTAASRDLSVLGLQMQRGFNATNASNIIAQISGSMGNSSSSNQSVVRLLQEGVALGLDSSKYADENRKFLEIGSQAIAKSGTTTAEGASAVLEGLSRFFGGDKSVQGIQAGASAYQKYQEISTSSTGPRGVLRAAGFLNSPMFGNLTPQDRMALSSIPDQELTPDDDRILAIARKTGKTAQEVIDERKRIDSNAVFRTNYAQSAADKYRKMKVGPYSPEVIDQARQNAMLGAQSEFPDMSRKELTQLVEGVSGGAGKYSVSAADVQSKLDNRNTGKIEDTTQGAQAEASRVMLENFQKMGDTIAPTAEAMAKFNKTLQQTIEIIMKMPESERGGILSKLFPNLYPQNQTQSGRPGGH